MRPVYILGLFGLLLPTILKAQEPINLSISIGSDSELTAIPRAQINGINATCIVSNNGENQVDNVYIEYNYYKLPNILTPAFTLYSAPFSIDSDATLEIQSDTPVFIAEDGQYQYSFTIKTEKPDLNISDNIVVKNIDIQNQLAMDDGLSVASIGIGNDILGEIGQVYTIQKDLQLDEVSIFLENITAVMTGEPVSINVYEFNKDGPQDLVLQSDTFWISTSVNDWITIPFSDQPEIEEGKYLFAVVENEKNLNLGMSESIFTPGRSWFRHENLGWTDTQDFNFTKPLMIRPAFSSLCDQNIATIEAESCEYFTSQSGQNTWLESGIYQEILPAYNYCDSIVEYDLTITKIETLVQQSNEILVAVEENADTYQWFDCNTGTLIAGETEQIFTAENNGTYQVLLTKGSCSFFSDCYTVITVGTLESNFKERIEIYPNPNDGFVNINMNEVIKELNINLVNVEGKTFFEREFQNIEIASFAVDIPPGTYIVQIHDDLGRKASLKIIKQ